MAFKKRTHIGDQEGLKLAGVTEEVTREEARKRAIELAKCYNDIDYFAENYFYIINQEGFKVKIKLFPKQREFLHKIRDNNRVINCSARQSCKSTTYSIFCLYQIITQQNYYMVIAGNKADTAREILYKIKEAYELIPNWIKPGIKTWNESKIIFENDVTIKTCPVNASSGRGLTVDLLILDEFSFCPKNFQSLFWAAVGPSVSARKKAKIVMVSTPNGVGDIFHKTWIDATNNPRSVWVSHKMDWWDRPDRDEAWHQSQLKTLGSQEKFDQEYGNSFNVTAGNKLIPDSTILELTRQMEHRHLEPVEVPVNPLNEKCKWTFNQYIPPKKGRTYIGSVDTAEGVGKDSSVFYIFDITEGTKITMVAKFDSSKIIPSEYAYVIHFISQKYGMPLLFIESNSIGIAVIDALTKTMFQDENVAIINRPTGEPGIFSHVQTKAKACMHTQAIAQDYHYTIEINDKDLLEELSFFEKKETNQHIVYKAAKDKHDDHVMAFIWGLFSLTDEILGRYFDVEYIKDEDSALMYPTSIKYNSFSEHTDISDGGQKKAGMSRDSKINTAMKWYELGDNERANYIMNTMFEEEAEETGNLWMDNPYQVDPSLFSKGFFGDDRYQDTYREQFDNSSDSKDNDGAIFVF